MGWGWAKIRNKNNFFLFNEILVNKKSQLFSIFNWIISILTGMNIIPLLLAMIYLTFSIRILKEGIIFKNFEERTFILLSEIHWKASSSFGIFVHLKLIVFTFLAEMVFERVFRQMPKFTLLKISNSLPRPILK